MNEIVRKNNKSRDKQFYIQNNNTIKRLKNIFAFVIYIRLINVWIESKWWNEQSKMHKELVAVNEK